MHRIDTSIPHFFSHLRVTHIVFTSEIVSEVLHVPRVANPDYPGCEHLRIVSNDELSSLFCETLLLGVIVKTPIAWALQKVQDSLTW